MLNIKNNQKGFAVFFITILILAVMFGVGVSLTILTLGEHNISRNIIKSSQAYYIAEAGVEDAIYRVKNSMNVSANYTLAVDEGSVDISIDSPSQNAKIITAYGNFRNVFRKLEASLTIAETAIPDFFYGMQVGEGGVNILGRDVQVIGNIFSNGSIQGEAGFSITGDAIVAGGTEPTADQEWTVQNSDFIFGKTVNGNEQIDVAQSFRVSKDEVINKVNLYIKKVGNPSDITIRVNKDKSGRPGERGGDVLTEGILLASLVTEEYGWIDVSFSSAPELDSTKTYWIVADASNDSDNYWVWGYDNTNGYLQGEGKYSKDWKKKNWFPINGDLNFRVWLGGLVTFIDQATVGVDVRANTITSLTVGQDAYGKTISNSTIVRDVFADSLSDCTIGRDAYFNTISSCTVGGSSTTPTTPPDDPAPGTWPISDGNIADWKAEAQAGTLIDGDYVLVQGQIDSLGPAKITGNMILENDTHLIMTGTIWVEGLIDVKKDTQITLDENYGSNSGVIISDGTMHFADDANLAGSPDPDSFILFVVLATGGGHHDMAINFHSRSNVEGIIFVPNGGVRLHKDVHVTQLTANYIEIEADSVIEYDTGLANLNFSAGPGASWKVASWKETE